MLYIVLVDLFTFSMKGPRLMTTPNQPEGGSHSNEYGAPSSNSYGDSSTQAFGDGNTNAYGQPNGNANSGFTAPQPDFNNGNSAYGAPQQGFQPNGNPQFGAYPNPDQNTGLGQTGADKDSFFGAIFDFSFRKYAAPSVVKIVYILAMIAIGLLVLIGLIGSLAAMTQDGGAVALFLIPLILIGALFYLVMIRVGLEVSIAMIRTSQSVQSIDERQARNEVSAQNHTGPFGG